MAADPAPITQVTVAWITLGGVALGAIISAGFMFWSQSLTRKSEERRQRRELAINTAIANWTCDREECRDMNNRGIKTAVAPLDHYIVHMIRLSDLVSRENLTEEEIAAELGKIKKATSKVFEAAKAEDIKEGRYP